MQKRIHRISASTRTSWSGSRRKGRATRPASTQSSGCTWRRRRD